MNNPDSLNISEESNNTINKWSVLEQLAEGETHTSWAGPGEFPAFNGSLPSEPEKNNDANALFTEEQIRESFTAEKLSKLTTEEYIDLLKHVPAVFSTHVTRQGVRDHFGNMNHSAGLNQYHDGFLSILRDHKKMRSVVGRALHSGQDEIESLWGFYMDYLKFMYTPDTITIDGLNNTNIANPGNLNGAGLMAGFWDMASVHFATNTTLEDYYGGESGNEIFFVFPGAFIASQYKISQTFDRSDQDFAANDQWVYDDGQNGIDLDAGFVFIPKNARVDAKTGSKYQIDEKMSPVLTEDGNLKVAESTVSAEEFWEGYFNANPGDRPAHVIYYEEDTPSAALNKWKEKNGLTTPLVNGKNWFADNFTEDAEAEETILKGFSDFREKTNMVAERFIPKKRINYLSDYIYKKEGKDYTPEELMKLDYNADLREILSEQDKKRELSIQHDGGNHDDLEYKKVRIHDYDELFNYLPAESKLKHAVFLRTKGIEFDVNKTAKKANPEYLYDHFDECIQNGVDIDTLVSNMKCPASLKDGFFDKLVSLGASPKLMMQKLPVDDVLVNFQKLKDLDQSVNIDALFDRTAKEVYEEYKSTPRVFYDSGTNSFINGPIRSDEEALNDAIVSVVTEGIMLTEFAKNGVNKQRVMNWINQSGDQQVIQKAKAQLGVSEF